MPLLKMALPIGLIVFGAIAAFMGFVVLVSALRAGELTYIYGPEGAPKTERVTQAQDPDAFWRSVGLMGGLPLLLGGAAVWYGRRMMRG